MRDALNKVASNSSNEETTGKPVVIGNGKRENSENYQRALTVLNEVVGILTFMPKESKEYHIIGLKTTCTSAHSKLKLKILDQTRKQ